MRAIVTQSSGWMLLEVQRIGRLPEVDVKRQVSDPLEILGDCHHVLCNQRTFLIRRILWDHSDAATRIQHAYRGCTRMPLLFGCPPLDLLDRRVRRDRPRYRPVVDRFAEFSNGVLVEALVRALLLQGLII